MSLIIVLKKKSRFNPNVDSLFFIEKKIKKSMPRSRCGFYITRRQKADQFLANIKKLLTRKFEFFKFKICRLKK